MTFATEKRGEKGNRQKKELETAQYNVGHARRSSLPLLPTYYTSARL